MISAVTPSFSVYFILKGIGDGYSVHVNRNGGVGGLVEGKK